MRLEEAFSCAYTDNNIFLIISIDGQWFPFEEGHSEKYLLRVKANPTAFNELRDIFKEKEQKMKIRGFLVKIKDYQKLTNTIIQKNQREIRKEEINKTKVPKRLLEIVSDILEVTKDLGYSYDLNDFNYYLQEAEVTEVKVSIEMRSTYFLADILPIPQPKKFNFFFYSIMKKFDSKRAKKIAQFLEVQKKIFCYRGYEKLIINYVPLDLAINFKLETTNSNNESSEEPKEGSEEEDLNLEEAFKDWLPVSVSPKPKQSQKPISSSTSKCTAEQLETHEVSKLQELAYQKGFQEGFKKGKKEGSRIQKEILEKLDLEKIALQKGLLKVRLISFSLPTEYKGAKSKIIKSGDTIVEQKVLVNPNKIRSLRRQFYYYLKRNAWKTLGFWIFFSEVDQKDLKKINDILKALNSLTRESRVFNILEAYFPADTLEQMLSEYIREITNRKQELTRKLQEEYEKGKEIRAIQNELERTETLLTQLYKEMKKIKQAKSS